MIPLLPAGIGVPAPLLKAVTGHVFSELEPTARTEEAVGSAKDIWTAFREGRFGQSPTPFLGYVFLLEDRDHVKTPVSNKDLYFQVDPEFRGEAHLKNTKSLPQHKGVSYSRRYERLYTSACFRMATNSPRTTISQPADDLTFHRFVAALRGHVVTFLGQSREIESL